MATHRTLTHETLTMSQIRTIREPGKAEFESHSAVIRPGRYSFANQDELNAYLVEMLGAKKQHGGIGGAISCKGRYVRQSSDGTPAVTFGDPVPDTISSASGTLVMGGRTTQLTALRPLANTPTRAATAEGGLVTLDTGPLKMTGIVNDAERWATDDGSLVEYRIGTGRLSFQAWRNGPSWADLGAWEMGVLVSVIDTPCLFEAAAITAINYMSLDSPCQQFLAGGPGVITDFNDSLVDLSDWGLLSQQPERVAGMCQAQWHHRQFADLVTAGSGCQIYKNGSWPTIFPPDWTPIATEVNLNGNWTDGSNRSAVISVTRHSLSVDMSAFGRPRANGTVNGFAQITVTFPDDRTYTGQLVGNTIRWSNGSQWNKVVNTIFDLNGSWTDGSPWVAVISEGPASLKVDMSDFDRPNAQGQIVNNSTITVNFPDAHSVTGTLVSPKTIKWSNGSQWTKKGV